MPKWNKRRKRALATNRLQSHWDIEFEAADPKLGRHDQTAKTWARRKGHQTVSLTLFNWLKYFDFGSSFRNFVSGPLKYIFFGIGAWNNNASGYFIDTNSIFNNKEAML